MKVKEKQSFAIEDPFKNMKNKINFIIQYTSKY